MCNSCHRGWLVANNSFFLYFDQIPCLQLLPRPRLFPFLLAQKLHKTRGYKCLLTLLLFIPFKSGFSLLLLKCSFNSLFLLQFLFPDPQRLFSFTFFNNEVFVLRIYTQCHMLFQLLNRTCQPIRHNMCDFRLHK